MCDNHRFSELSDEEWATVEPLIPASRSGGRRRTSDMRAILNGVIYRVMTGSTKTPKHFPPRTTLNEYYRRWTTEPANTLEEILSALGLEVVTKPVTARVVGSMHLEQARQRTGFYA